MAFDPKFTIKLKNANVGRKYRFLEESFVKPKFGPKNQKGANFAPFGEFFYFTCRLPTVSCRLVLVLVTVEAGHHHEFAPITAMGVDGVHFLGVEFLLGEQINHGLHLLASGGQGDFPDFP